MALTETETPRLIYLKYKPPFFWPAFNSLPSLQLANSFSKMASSHLQVFFSASLAKLIDMMKLFRGRSKRHLMNGEKDFFFFFSSD